MMQIPQLMSRIWDGDPNEYFSHRDMNRVEYNANILAKYAEVQEQGFINTTRESAFRFDEAQKLENLIEQVGIKVGVPITIEDYWNYNRTVSFVDFERWESETWKIYKAMGGIGDRIPSDKTLHTINATLFPDEWKGPGPYYQDLDISSLTDNSEAIAYVSENASVTQRTEEYNAVLQAVYTGNRRMKVYAHSIKPRESIPLKITTKVFEMYKSFGLKASDWQGSGPWTQTVDLGTEVTNAVIGSDDRNDPNQVQAFMEAIIGVSGINGTKVTIRAIGKKPSINVNTTIMWSAESTE